ncbi:hypothetical protein Syun_019665 [Stephania yunnanensis]|uniref:Mur ligase central domain-containing protein n=1 Tax=Stephania yunnanensis TaxID=152371 RepID=A0AAP0NWW0_9MAGN
MNNPNFFNSILRFTNLSKTRIPAFPNGRIVEKLGFLRRLSSNHNEDIELTDFMEYMEKLKNYEKSGVPKGAGTDSGEGFDMGRMNRLMQRLGNPQSNFKAVHIAGTKGKGSTANFLANILREEGYSVGCYTSPHVHSIRERISLGKEGDPVSAEKLSCLFHRVKNVIDRSIELENGMISHFEVLTAMSFTLFAEENVDIAVVEAGLGGSRDATNVICSSSLLAAVITTIGKEHLAALGGSLESIAMAKSGIIKHGRPVVLGGPFDQRIEQILRDKAKSSSAPVILVSDPGIISTVKDVRLHDGRPCQLCDIHIQIEKDIPLFIELLDVRLHMLGKHQLQNAVTAACTSLCLRNQGWKVSDESIRTGLENATLLGRSQFLSSEEAKAVGFAGAIVLVDGAHTGESAKCLIDTINMTHPNSPLALVVAMANDKDHSAFTRQLLLGRLPEAVVLTEISIAGDRSRITPASLLKGAWIQAAKELDVEIADVGAGENELLFMEQLSGSAADKERKTVLATSGSLQSSLKLANQILTEKTQCQSGLIVVTGSLHIVSLILTLCQ